MRANRYSKTVRQDGAKSSKKNYNNPKFNSSQYSQIPKSRNNKKTKKENASNKPTIILARIYLFIFILFLIMFFAVVLL